MRRPGLPRVISVLFLCTGNSARSQMAEALLRHLSHGQVDVVSAGSAPAAHVHPLAVATLESTFGIDATGSRPKSMDEFVGRRFDYVITLCDRAGERCPVFPGDPARLHWDFDDPAAVQGEAERRRAFETVAVDLAARLRSWLALPNVQARVAERTRSAAEERGIPHDDRGR
jgi:protein-tyrosine-phosphatase